MREKKKMTWPDSEFGHKKKKERKDEKTAMKKEKKHEIGKKKKRRERNEINVHFLRPFC
jgi:hypothetical protein